MSVQGGKQLHQKLSALTIRDNQVHIISLHHTPPTTKVNPPNCRGVIGVGAAFMPSDKSSLNRLMNRINQGRVERWYNRIVISTYINNVTHRTAGDKFVGFMLSPLSPLYTRRSWVNPRWPPGTNVLTACCPRIGLNKVRWFYAQGW